MTDAVEKRYKEAVANLTKTHGNHDERTARCILEDIGFRALLEIEEAAREYLKYRGFSLDDTAGNHQKYHRLRAALAARATDAAEGEQM